MNLSNIRIKWILGLTMVLAISSCLKDDDGNDPGQPVNYKDLELEIRQIPNLGFDYFFHLWLSHGNELKDLGEIEADAQGNFAAIYSFTGGELNQNPVLFVTAEPFDDPDPMPSEWKLMEVTFADGDGLVNNAPFIRTGSADQAMGSYILATPTTLTTADETAGIWFVDRSSTPQMGLSLPELDDNWVYEAWVDLGSIQLSTGPFRNPNGSDDRSSYSSSERPPYPFPGEDFVQALPGIPVPDLRGKTCFITIEPTDRVSSPFFLTIMTDPIDPMTIPGTPQAIASAGTGSWLVADIKRK